MPKLKTSADEALYATKAALAAGHPVDPTHLSALIAEIERLRGIVARIRKAAA